MLIEAGIVVHEDHSVNRFELTHHSGDWAGEIPIKNELKAGHAASPDSNLTAFMTSSGATAYSHAAMAASSPLAE